MPGRDVDTWMGGENGDFATTLWTVVLRAKDAASPERRHALEKLVETYWKPLYHYVRCRGLDREAGKDAVQGFFTSLLEKDLLQYLDPARARFRTFLLLAMKHHISSIRSHDTALKRGGGRPVFSLDFESAEREVQARSPAESAEQAFRREWATRVLEQALERLRCEYESSGRAAEFEVVRLHLGDGSGSKRSYADLATSLGWAEHDVRNSIHRAKGRYREAILAVIRAYSEGEEQAREELRDLLAAFST